MNREKGGGVRLSGTLMSSHQERKRGVQLTGEEGGLEKLSSCCTSRCRGPESSRCSQQRTPRGTCQQQAASSSTADSKRKRRGGAARQIRQLLRASQRAWLFPPGGPCRNNRRGGAERGRQGPPQAASGCAPSAARGRKEKRGKLGGRLLLYDEQCSSGVIKRVDRPPPPLLKRHDGHDRRALLVMRISAPAARSISMALSEDSPEESTAVCSGVLPTFCAAGI